MENQNFKNYQTALENFCLTHKSKSNNHNIQIDRFENAYKNYYENPKYLDFERDICTCFENADHESLLIFEQFIGE